MSGRGWNLLVVSHSRFVFEVKLTVTDYLHFAGWKDVEIVDLCARDEDGKRVTDDQGTVLVDSPRLPSHLDPLWVVRATKRTL
jgi:hypothetical protein